MNLSTAQASKRAKEVGIKKIGGSSRGMLITQFLTESFILVSISALIAWPLIYYIVEHWLQHFYYKINLEIFSFIAGLFIALGISLITISYRILKAATVNPAQSLKYE